MVMIWTTREGNEIAIAQMTDDHLRNVITYLERRHDELCKEERAALSAVMHFQGEMALDAANEHLELTAMRIAEVEQWLNAMNEERGKRCAR